ncbi:diguanylate cyclase response regulator [Pseudoalteromonas ruthenica]|uniref:GGDEF domain-containing response regulator n=1 Tax=Pseudoalteromonas ruthenica TaxID=151081 RepID=UPI001108ADAE|nr:diguanylate cyclase [Pseudoalteromonas ruthenica]TLX51485.1 diguanylate cyclase response regulator [Pseudoalteromonas ruthenica]
MRPARILVVDDDELNRVILEKTLIPKHNVICVESAETMFEWLATNSVDLILLDIVMPGMDGYEALRKLKHGERTQPIPVIIISANDSLVDEAKGLELGAMDYITKPFGSAIVRARVKNQLTIKQKNDLLEMLASIDGLTEIPNRRYFDEQLSREWRRSVRAGLPLSVVLIDIDFFKRYNDHYGHQRGDECLKKVASTLVANCQRGSDFVARYGGEEFAAVLPGSEEGTAMALAQKLKRVIEELNVAHIDSPVADHVTISMGVSTYPGFGDAQSESQLIERADRGLYKAKQQGRNTIVFFA